jgi:hypothetical protein
MSGIALNKFKSVAQESLDGDPRVSRARTAPGN